MMRNRRRIMKWGGYNSAKLTLSLTLSINYKNKIIDKQKYFYFKKITNNLQLNYM